jgi:4-hydroxy-2-oxoheptanedioate aldolase
VAESSRSVAVQEDSLMLKENLTKKRLQQGKVAFGTMVRMIRSPEVVPVLATAGWDYIVVDTEHCAFNSETLNELALVASYEPLSLLVRIPDKHYHQLAQTLDFGANGLVIPRVESKDQAKLIVESTKYFPLGQRGASKTSIGARFPECGTMEYLEWANRETLIVVQIESQLGVENADEILAFQGIDAVMIGPFDLSQSMGIPGRMDDPNLKDAFRAVIEACQRNGVAPGIHLQSLEAVEHWIGEGMRFITFQYDMSLLRNSSIQALTHLRAILGER